MCSSCLDSTIQYSWHILRLGIYGVQVCTLRHTSGYRLISFVRLSFLQSLFTVEKFTISNKLKNNNLNVLEIKYTPSSSPHHIVLKLTVVDFGNPPFTHDQLLCNNRVRKLQVINNTTKLVGILYNLSKNSIFFLLI